MARASGALPLPAAGTAASRHRAQYTHLDGQSLELRTRLAPAHQADPRGCPRRLPVTDRDHAYDPSTVAAERRAPNICGCPCSWAGFKSSTDQPVMAVIEQGGPHVVEADAGAGRTADVPGNGAAQPPPSVSSALPASLSSSATYSKRWLRTRTGLATGSTGAMYVRIQLPIDRLCGKALSAVR